MFSLFLASQQDFRIIQVWAVTPFQEFPFLVSDLLMDFVT